MPSPRSKKVSRIALLIGDMTFLKKLRQRTITAAGCALRMR
jgi:hypothetical protein